MDIKLNLGEVIDDSPSKVEFDKTPKQKRISKNISEGMAKSSNLKKKKEYIPKTLKESDITMAGISQERVLELLSPMEKIALKAMKEGLAGKNGHIWAKLYFSYYFGTPIPNKGAGGGNMVANILITPTRSEDIGPNADFEEMNIKVDED